MKEKISKKYKHSHNLDEMEEAIVLIIMNLFVYSNDINLLRLINKFSEKNYSKVDRLIELHCKYWNRIEENDIETLKQLKHSNEELASERYQRRMDIGLSTLQCIDMIIAFVYTLKNNQINTRVDQLLSQNDNDLQIVKDIIKEFAIVSKDDDDDEDEDDENDDENNNNDEKNGNKNDNKTEKEKEKEKETHLGSIAAKLYQMMDQMTQVIE